MCIDCPKIQFLTPGAEQCISAKFSRTKRNTDITGNTRTFLYTKRITVKKHIQTLNEIPKHRHSGILSSKSVSPSTATSRVYSTASRHRIQYCTGRTNVLNVSRIPADQLNIFFYMYYLGATLPYTASVSTTLALPYRVPLASPPDVSMYLLTHWYTNKYWS